jgi:3-hydroxybutyryl-CoA dehydrogenase
VLAGGACDTIVGASCEDRSASLAGVAGVARGFHIQGGLVGVNKVLVAGAGQMGAGIVQVSAAAGLEVTMIDVADEFLERGMTAIAKGLERLVAKGKMAAEARDAALARITTGTDVAAGAAADLFVEAAPEVMTIKQELFARACDVLRDDAVIATNTSSLPVTKLAQHVSNPRRFVGIHFFNPVPAMTLVEVVKGAETSAATLAAARAFAETVGKTPITVTDTPGFVVNRILFPMINEAAQAFADGVASAADIDTGMKLGANWPMGPLALADLVGLDTTKAILESLARETGAEKYRPAAVLDELVAAGKLGRKSGAGFYDYAA